MILDVDVLGASVVLGIVSEGNSALVVAINEVLVVDVVADFPEKVEELDLLLESVEKSHIFGFG